VRQEKKARAKAAKAQRLQQQQADVNQPEQPFHFAYAVPPATVLTAEETLSTFTVAAGFGWNWSPVSRSSISICRDSAAPWTMTGVGEA
jgi:hypothetical protein